jgi:TolA-binding protein
VQRIGAVLVLTRPTIRLSSILFLFALFLSSCGIWDSMTAYFNTFYNARRVYEEAEDELWTQRDVQQFGRNYFLATFTNPNKTKFTQVIEKCSKLLQYHGESGLVNDALYLIGMSSFYQGDFQQADRKFRELLERNPGGKLAARGGVMLAYTQYRLVNRDTAATIAGQLYDAASQEGDDAIVGQCALLRGQIDKDRESLAKARDYFLKAGETCDNAELRTTAYLTAAQLAEGLPDYAGAESAYRSAEKATRSYVGEYRSQLGVARMRALQGDYVTALEQLKALFDNQNYKEFAGETVYEMGNVRRLSGDIPQALVEYSYVDTAFARTEVAAKAAYEIGLLYETQLQNLDSARVAYTRGKNHSSTGAMAPILARKAEVFGSYIQYRNELNRLDSLRSAWVRKRDTVAAMKDSLEKAAVTANPQKPDSALAAAAKALTLPNIDSLDQRIANTRVDLAILFYTGMNRPDSAAYWYHRFLQASPNHPAVPRALYTLAEIARQDSTKKSGNADSLYREIVTRFPSSDFADEARKTLGLPEVKRSKGEAEEQYSEAADLIKSGNYAEAVRALRKITTSFPSSPMAPRAQYAIGWLYENQINSPDSAIANYELLVSKFPGSSYVPLVQPKLMEVQNARTAAKVDSTKTSPKLPKDEDLPGRGRRAGQPQPPKEEREHEK